MLSKWWVAGAFASVLGISTNLSANVEKMVLVNVGPQEITAHDLEKTINSSPFGTQFTSMDEKDQALLRGNILKRLVSSRLLYLEARDMGLDKSDEFIKEAETFRQGLLYRKYMDKLRSRLTVPDDVLAEFKEKFKGNRDALAGAKALYLSRMFKEIRLFTVRQLKEKYHARIMEENIKADELTDDTLLMTADGFEIRYRDILNNSDGKPVSNPEWIEQQLYNQGELLLVVRAAEDEGFDVSAQVRAYEEENLPALLLAKKNKEWIPNTLVLQQYYETHPEFSKTMGFWHVGQLVTSSYAQANALHKRILKGESLFKLAGQYSIDPYGRQKNGDIGWVREGKGLPVVEAELKRLKDNEISKIIKTDHGYQILTVLERRPGTVRSFLSMPDKIRQAFIAEKLSSYLKKLEEKFKVSWHIETRKDVSAQN